MKIYKITNGNKHSKVIKPIINIMTTANPGR